MLSKAIGDFGEYITALVLEKKFEKEGISVIRVGAENVPYDLMIPSPCKNTPFKSPAVISVKTRGTWWDVIPPNRKLLKEQVSRQSKLGFDFWISFVKYNFTDNGLSFSVHLVPGNRLNEDADFRRVKRSEGFENQIVTTRLIAKSVLSFESLDATVQDR